MFENLVYIVTNWTIQFCKKLTSLQKPILTASQDFRRVPQIRENG